MGFLSQHRPEVVSDELFIRVVDQIMNRIYNPYFKALFQQGDINEHLPVLFSLGLQCQTIVEFGVRGGSSTTALLTALKMQSRQTSMYSYDILECPGPIAALKPLCDDNTIWSFIRADTSQLKTIPECDLLFIDTLHTHDQVTLELRHGNAARRWIVIHDTVLFGVNGEQGQPGIRIAIDTFRHRNPDWRIRYEYKHNNGLLILERI
jgi:hypothetical protein